MDITKENVRSAIQTLMQEIKVIQESREQMKAKCIKLKELEKKKSTLLRVLESMKSMN